MYKALIGLTVELKKCSYSELLEENYDLDLNYIEKWMAANKLTMNQGKTKTTAFSSKKIKLCTKF